MKICAIESRESKVRSSKPRQCERGRREPSRGARGSALADRKCRLAAGRSGEARSRPESGFRPRQSLRDRRPRELKTKARKIRSGRRLSGHCHPEERSDEGSVLGWDESRSFASLRMTEEFAQDDRGMNKNSRPLSS